jgi:uncharacterized paraquat-inducible protein A
MKSRNIIALVLVFISYVLLIPGLTWPLITIRASFVFMGNTIEIFNQTRSILQSIKDLHESNNDFVAALILLFSVVVPFVKGAMLGAAALIRDPMRRYQSYAFVRSISKWAMADVFAMGVWVAYLASKAAENFDAEIRVGFYFFVAYCLVSLLALQFMSVPRPRNASAANE